MLVLSTILLALAAWATMFLPGRRGVWHRTTAAAAILATYAVVVLAVTDRLDEVVGPIDPTEVAIGLGVGATWLLATHVGYRIVAAVFPTFAPQVADLYRIEKGNRVRWMPVPVLAMGVAEELVFRGIVQDRAGLLVAVAAYSAVQVVERKWALVLAAVLGGLVWGALFEWRDGLVAPVVAHVAWTGTLTFLWKLPAARLEWLSEADRSGVDGSTTDPAAPSPIPRPQETHR